MYALDSTGYIFSDSMLLHIRWDLWFKKGEPHMIARKPNCQINERKLILKEKLYKPKIYLFYSEITFISKEGIT